MKTNNFFKQNKVLVIIVAVVLIIIGIGIFGSSGNDSKTTTAVTINKAVQTKCLSEVNDVRFCKFVGTFAGVGSYSAVMTSTSNGVNTSAQVSIAANGNGSMMVKEGTATSNRIVVYGGYTYILDTTDNQWLSYAPGDSSAPSLLDIKKSMAEGDFKNSSGQVEQYVYKGTEVVYGTNCFKYQIVDPAQPDQVGYIWFDTGNYLLRKLSSKDATTDMTMTFSYGSVTITKPTPVKGSAN